MTWDLEKFDRDYTECSIKLDELKKKNKGKHLSEWPDISEWSENEKTEYEFFAEEMAHRKDNHNSLVAKYNKEMARTKWCFTDFRYIPEGIENRPLPREFKFLP